MKDLIWLDSVIRSTDGTWCTKGFFRDGEGFIPQEQPYSSLPSEVVKNSGDRFENVRTTEKKFTWYDLKAADPLVYPRELLESFAKDIPITDGHTIFSIGDEEPFYVPAALLIRALFMGSRLLDRYILIPNAVDLLGFVNSTENEIEIKTTRDVKALDLSGRFARTLAWMLTQDDGKKAHASVLKNAYEGKICLDLPSISMAGWAYGIQVGNGLLVTELKGLDVKFPLTQDTISIQVGKTTKQFTKYEPSVKSPLSREKAVERGLSKI